MCDAYPIRLGLTDMYVASFIPGCVLYCVRCVCVSRTARNVLRVRYMCAYDAYDLCDACYGMCGAYGTYGACVACVAESLLISIVFTGAQAVITLA
jgi:hypothetical protein